MSNWKTLLFKLAHVGYQPVNLGCGKFLPERGHFAQPVRDRVEETLVADARLPRRVRQIARVKMMLRLESVRLTILAVTGRAILGVKHARVCVAPRCVSVLRGRVHRTRRDEPAETSESGNHQRDVLCDSFHTNCPFLISQAPLHHSLSGDPSSPRCSCSFWRRSFSISGLTTLA